MFFLLLSSLKKAKKIWLGAKNTNIVCTSKFYKRHSCIYSLFGSSELDESVSRRTKHDYFKCFKFLYFSFNPHESYVNIDLFSSAGLR